ncbi:valine--tRNA ligase [Candidatus Parcubacteria bacterium]|nr:MAG: valine--tRNA ligase [Candidatus Parcubacteria bacterium]
MNKTEAEYKPYDPKETEPRIYKLWEDSGFFNPDNLPGKRDKNFVIMLPPPNVTGSLHMGHALEHSLSDAIIRWKRMKGFKTLWLPGTDHAGIATQNVVEKEIKKEGLSRHKLGRDKFLERVWAWKEKYGNAIVEQMKKLGNSLDWSRIRFTMDENYQKAVKEAFLHYHKKGLIYQGERTVNWCTRCGTSLSDLELNYSDEKAILYHIKYGPLTLATVRPETKLGDTGVAVHPEDKRYQKYIGKEIEIESVEGKAKMKVVADERVDPEFGTGVIKVTPAHDILDFEIGQKNNLPVKSVIGPDGKMNENAGPYKGLSVIEARKKIVEDMKLKGLIVKEEEYQHRVAKCYRCDTIIEPLPSKQWFLKISDEKHSLAKTAIEAVKKGRIKISPKKWEKVYFDWLENIKDWNISRQIWWGHKIPIDGVDDVLDTWFSSALWPFATLGWPEKTSDLKTFYPTTFMTSARDILHLWITRMIFSGLEFMNKEPFGEVYIHPTVLTKTGKRMSKSLGTGIDPLELIEKYGADATRFGLLWQVLGGQDIRFGEESAVAGKKFANKIWNAGRFLIPQLNPNIKYNLKWPKNNETELDKQMRSDLAGLISKVDKGLSDFEFGDALHELYEYFWKKFADVYIEDIKKRKDQDATHRAFIIYATLLKLLHPFMPFVTEAIYDKLPIENKLLLVVENWPQAEELK